MIAGSTDGPFGALAAVGSLEQGQSAPTACPPEDNDPAKILSSLTAQRGDAGRSSMPGMAAAVSSFMNGQATFDSDALAPGLLLSNTNLAGLLGLLPQPPGDQSRRGSGLLVSYLG
jgi:hypothetical protein